MPGIERINRELARLDSELRANRIDRATFRARRRQLLLDFEERESTTTPGAATGETTPAASLPVTAGSASAQPPEPSGKSVGLLVTGVAALGVLVLGALWFFGSRDGARLATAARPTATTTETSSADPALPQGVADALMKSAWSTADVDEFLDRWARLSPESISAASDDPRIWLLRGEAEQRLRAAREAESVDSSPETLARSAQLQRLYDVIRAR